ncbi:hypothetical protein J2799_000152 [Chryseobacterium vietnamense]|nr:hypothetical protein [Chryseobacterium vietnamense]
MKNIRIYSAGGILVEDLKNLNTDKINISTISSGVYFIEAITVDGKDVKEKVVKN